METIIKIEGLTKVYKNGQGIKDINIDVKKGEIFGYLGPNGAGKSTTIRHLLGFVKGQKGTIIMNDLDVWKNASKVNEITGYIPGEIAMPEFMTGLEFIKYIFKLRKMKDWSVVQQEIDFWEFDVNRKIKRMSKGMKQKVGLVCAFMHNPEILILDEPTSGLDPLMQDRFIKRILDFKEKGATVILSSHIFQEVEKTCDRVAIIKNGEIISEIDMHKIFYTNTKVFEIQFEKVEDFKKNDLSKYEIISKKEKWNSITLKMDISKVNELIKDLTKYKLKYFKEIPYTLEEHFMHFYGKDDDIDGGTK